MDREAWRAAIHGVAKSGTWLSNWTELKIPGCCINPYLKGEHYFHGNIELSVSVTAGEEIQSNLKTDNNYKTRKTRGGGGRQEETERILRYPGT